MAAYLPFTTSTTSSSTLAAPSDDPHLEVTVTPSASAYYAGETFSVTIRFRNTRTPSSSVSQPASAIALPIVDLKTADPVLHAASHEAPATPTTQALPQRRRQIGLAYTSENVEAGPSRPSPPPFKLDLSLEASYPYSPGADPTFRASGWPGPSYRGRPVFRSPEVWQREYGGLGKGKGNGRDRRTRSLAIGKAGMSPQEMVWALSAQQTVPPPLPSRRLSGMNHIPPSHPHSRKPSFASVASPPVSAPLPLISPDLYPILEAPPHVNRKSLPLRPSLRTSPSTSSASASQSVIDLNDDDLYESSEITTPSSRPYVRPSPSSSRPPSYNNAYGISLPGLNGSPTALPPPPSHPYIRRQEAVGTTTVLWAYTRLVAQFHPSNSYIPPDPLLPLRSLLLHQPIGSGSLIDPSMSTSSSSTSGMMSSSSRWQLSFGTGSLGTSTHPSLTGSLFGLAKDLVYGGGGGSLEEERKRVWNMKDLPVLETTKSLLGIDMKLKEGAMQEYVYTMQLPSSLPPSHRGKAFRFTYDLIVSLNVLLPGSGKRQKSKDISIPIRVWANVSLSHPFHTYDVLQPIIQTKQEGNVHEQAPGSNHAQPLSRRRASSTDPSKVGQNEDSLRAYAKHLLDLPSGIAGSPRLPPGSPSKITPSKPFLSPHSVHSDEGSSPVFERGARLPDHLEVPNGRSRSIRGRKSSFIDSDDDLLSVVDEAGKCGKAVEILSRHSTKASFDIAKDGEVVAVLTLIKTTYRLGETVLGVVTFNGIATERRVLHLSAYLESHEIIPENLLPLSASSAGHIKQPSLGRLHAEYRSAYVINSSRLAFSLDIPSDATPAFSIGAGKHGAPGGLEWKVRLAFAVATPPNGWWRRGHRHDPNGGRPETSANHQALHLLPVSPLADQDNRLYTATTTLAPLLSDARAANRDGSPQDTNDPDLVEMKTDTVECEIPIRILAGNTAFTVRPHTYVI